MKIQLRSILFALVLPVAACGGDRDGRTTGVAVENPTPKVSATDAPAVTVAQDLAETPKLVDVAKPMPTKYDELLVAGKDLVAKGQFGDAKEMFEAAAKLEKKKADPHIELARMYITMNEKGLAVAAASKAVKLAPDSSQAWNTKGRAELNAHKYDEAVEAFTKAVELNDTNVFAWNNLGYTELQLKKYEDAAEHLMQATSRDGATGYMFNNLGTALEHLDKLDDARTAYEMGGNLGSKEASSSRKRLEGVDTIAVANVEPTVDTNEVKPEPTPPVVKEYSNVDDSDDGDDIMQPDEDAGSGSGSGSAAPAPAPEAQPGDHATL